MKIFISGIILFFITLAVNAQNSISSFEQLLHRILQDKREIQTGRQGFLRQYRKL